MKNKISKKDWSAMFRDIGLSDEKMMEWHNVFERRHPEAHENFLGWLGISSDEIADIRTNSK